SGVVYVVPRANQPALDTGTRHTPMVQHSNLNRNFPMDDRAPRGRLARHLWSLVKEVQPDVLLDLHEGCDYNIQNRRSVGNTILYAPQDEEMATRLVRQMVAAVNETESDLDQRFRAWKPPVVGSLARATAERLGSVAMILETTKKTDLDQRVEQHSVMVETALRELGMVGPACEDGPNDTRVSVGQLQGDDVEDERSAADKRSAADVAGE